MSNLAVHVEGIGKQYQLGLREKANQTLREAIVGMASAPLRRLKHLSGRSEEGQFWALRDISFGVAEGEVLGIIGHNGAGKSTLLKILSRITEPTEGRAIIHGRVASLLEVGTGFHNELSGRENVYLNGAILGMTKVEIDRRFDEIVDFSGLDRFLDTPIKRYSSGMKVRLAFAVAAHLEPEILIIDEVLAVGDAEFQSKCLGKMNDVAQSGRTVLFVSHNMSAVEALCTRAIILKAGNVIEDGEPDEVISRYVRNLKPQSSGTVDFDDESSPIKRARIVAPDGRVSEAVMLGEDMTFEVDFEPDQPLDDVMVAFYIANQLDHRVVACLSKQQWPKSISLDIPSTLSCRIRDVRLVPGSYTVDILVSSGGVSLAEHLHVLEFEVIRRDLYGTGRIPKAKNCVYLPDADWAVSPVAVTASSDIS